MSSSTPVTPMLQEAFASSSAGGGGPGRGKRSAPSSSTSASHGPAKKRKLKRQLSSRRLRSKEMDEIIARYSHMDFLETVEPVKSMDTALVYAEPCEVFKTYAAMHPFPGVRHDDDNLVFVKANSVVEMAHLDRFNHDPQPFPGEYRDIIALATEYITGLMAPTQLLEFPSIGDLQGVGYYGDKYPGYEYASMGFKCRSDADPVAQVDAEEAWLELMEGRRVEPHLVRMGGRGKMTTKEKIAAAGGSSQCGRLIMMTSHRDLKLAGVTENQLTEISKADGHPVAIGQSWWHGGVARFLKRWGEYERFLCFDAKKFDSSIPPWLLRIAINMARSQYEDGFNLKYDAYWDFIHEGMCFGKMVLDNGCVLQRRTGSTTGASHNTLLQSYCTLIVGYVAIALANPTIAPEEVWRDCWLEAQGDDQITGLRGPVRDTPFDEVTRWAWKVFNIDWQGSKSFATTKLYDGTITLEGVRGPDAFQGVQFLGKYFGLQEALVDGRWATVPVPYRPSRETGERMLFPEYGNLTLEGAWERALGHYADGAGNPETRMWLEGYMDWLRPQLKEDLPSWSNEARRKFTHGDVKARVWVPTHRIGHREWTELVTGGEIGSVRGEP